MYVRCVESFAELERYRDAWDGLAGGTPFRLWSWCRAWWRHYGEEDEARALRVYLTFRGDAAEAPELVGVLPCYLDWSWSQGRALRLLGDGEVCSDHTGLLAANAVQDQVADLLADELVNCRGWDLIDFAEVDADDAATDRLFSSLALRGCDVSRLDAGACWAIDLPPTWEEFLAMQSKSHRKQLRQLVARVLQTDRARWTMCENPAQFSAAWSKLIHLHQRRRISLGEPGCFASARWASFHWEVAQEMLAAGKLRLAALELDGRPIAAEYHFAGPRTTYAYQGGVDPDRLHDEPGQLSTICSIERAISQGHTTFDLLRGDEPYKAHWRATPRPALRLVAVPSRLWPKLRRGAWSSVRDAARLARQVAGRSDRS